MTHSEATMTSKGQITVPAVVREFMRLQAGDALDFYIDEAQGEVRVRARNKPVAELFGTLNKYASPSTRGSSIETMNESVGQLLANDDRRIQAQWLERPALPARKHRKRLKAAE